MTGADRDPHAPCYRDDRKSEAVKDQVLCRHFEAWPQLDRDGRTGFALAFCVNPRHAPRGRHDLGI
jgi:hypothetical protein